MNKPDIRKAFDASKGISFDEEAGVFYYPRFSPDLEFDLPVGTIVLSDTGTWQKYGNEAHNWRKFKTVQDNISEQYLCVQVRDIRRWAYEDLFIGNNVSGRLNTLEAFFKRNKRWGFYIQTDENPAIEVEFPKDSRFSRRRDLHVEFKNNCHVKVWCEDKDNEFLLEGVIQYDRES